MEAETPRLRVIGGPNGSGKSSLLPAVEPWGLGVYLNADMACEALSSEEGFDAATWGLDQCACRLVEGAKRSGMASLAEGVDWSLLTLDGSRLRFPSHPGLPYFAAALVESARSELMAMGASMTTETVMSHPSKVQLLAQARACRYRTYLYYVATDSPEINVERVRTRVQMGGHSVPEDKIRMRYWKSLDLLADAIRLASRAYVFDNTQDGSGPVWLAEFEDGSQYQYFTDMMPEWFLRAVDSKLAGS